MTWHLCILLNSFELIHLNNPDFLKLKWSTVYSCEGNYYSSEGQRFFIMNMPLTSTPLLTHTAAFCFRCFLWLWRFIPGSILKNAPTAITHAFLLNAQSTFISKCFFSSFQTEMIVLVRSDIAQLQQVSLSYSVSVSFFGSLSLSLSSSTHAGVRSRLAGLSELLCAMSGVIHLVARIINFLLEGLT